MMRFLRNGAAALVVLGALSTGAMAAGPDVNATVTGLALRGYDPVAYFADGAPKKGLFNITAEYEGAFYRFATEAHKEAFLKDPAKYVPQFGGFCAFGTSKGGKYDGDPEVWEIVDGKLYLNFAPAVHDLWAKDKASLIGQANENWATIKDKPPEELK